MTYDKQGFTEFYTGSEKACASYRSYLNKADAGVGGIDQFLEQHTGQELLTWADEHQDLLQPSPRSTKSAIRKYLEFRGTPSLDAGDDDSLAEIESALFRLERDMQAAVRQQLSQIEPGLVVDDGGTEMTVATGRIDIVAKDATGTRVVIELKAGKSPAGALEQLLGYADDLAFQTQSPVRAMLVAGGFSDRQKAAARRASVELRTYSYALTFTPAS